MVLTNTLIKKYWPNFTFYFLLVLVLLSKFLVLKNYCFQYTGSDDTILWQTAVDYSSGVFHEPYFYGQNYNFSLEGLLSVPMIILGVPVYFAVPITSSVVGVFPFLLIAIILYRRGYQISSCLFLLIPIALPIEYDIITSISRGFTTGLFFSAFLIFPILAPESKRSFIILGLSVSFGYVFNPNSVIFSLPICLYLLFHNYKTLKFYLFGLLGVIPALTLQYFAQQFYITHPNYLVHSMWPFLYDFDAMLEGFSQLGNYFRYLTPLIWSGTWHILILILILGLLIVKKNWKKGISMILSLLFVAFTLGIYKVNDDLGVIFLSSVRMFLGIPLMLGLALFWVLEEIKPSMVWNFVIVTIASIVLLFKVINYPDVIQQHTDEKNYGPIAIKSLDELFDECNYIEQLASEYNVDLVVFLPGANYNVPSIEFYNYGCPIIEKNAFSTVMSVYERRTWVFEQEKYNRRTKLLLFNQSLDQIKEFQKVLDCEIVSRTPDILFIKNNTRSLEELSEIFKFQFKRNTY